MTKAQIYSVYMDDQSRKRLTALEQASETFQKTSEKQTPEMFQLRNGTFRWQVESNGLQSGPESGFHNSLQVKFEPEFVNILGEPRNRFPAWWAGMTTLFDVPARQLHRLAESIPWN
jgi:hypothetical protein